MNDSQLTRVLQSIGLECFVKHYELFNTESISTDDAVDTLMHYEDYAEAGARTRVNCARRIFRENLEVDALKIIVASKRVPTLTVTKARNLLEAA